MTPPSDPCLFALQASRAWAEPVAARLGVPLAAHEERAFEDGEHKVRPLVNVRGRDVYVMESLHGDEAQTVDAKLCRLLFFIGALKDAAAGRVTAVVPYLGYARKDRKTKARDPVTTRYVAALFEAVGTDRIVTLDPFDIAEWRERGNLYFKLGHHRAACEDFRRYLALAPQADDAEAVMAQLIESSGQAGRLH